MSCFLFVVGVGYFMFYCYKMSLCVRYECFVFMFDMFNSERRFVWWILEGVVYELGFGMWGGHGELHVWHNGLLVTC